MIFDTLALTNIRKHLVKNRNSSVTRRKHIVAGLHQQSIDTDCFKRYRFTTAIRAGNDYAALVRIHLYIEGHAVRVNQGVPGLIQQQIWLIGDFGPAGLVSD